MEVYWEWAKITRKSRMRTLAGGRSAEYPLFSF